MIVNKQRSAFSMIELLVVIAIIAVLVGIVVPAVSNVRARAARVSDENKLRQIGIAAHSANNQRGRLPPLNGPCLLPYKPDIYCVVMFSLLPYLESGWDGPDPRSYPRNTTMYLSPSDTSNRGLLEGNANYAANVAVFGEDNPVPCGLNDGKASIPNSFGDGTSNTLLFATRRAMCGDYNTYYVAFNLKGYCHPPTRGAFFGQSLPPLGGAGPTFQDVPSVANCDTEQPHSLQRGGLSVCLADGSVRTIRPGIAPEVWRAAVLPNDGQVPGPDW